MSTVIGGHRTIGRSWGPNSRIGTIAISSGAVIELKVASTALNGRHTLYVSNDTNVPFYIKNSTKLGSSMGLLVNTGTSFTIVLDPGFTQKIYAQTLSGTATTKVAEFKT